MDRTALGRALRPLERDRLVAVGRRAGWPHPQGQPDQAGQARFKTAAARWRQAQKEFEGAYGEAAAQDLRSSLRRVVEAA